MGTGDEDGRDLTRRRFLEGTGAAIGLIAVGDAGCSDGADGSGAEDAGPAGSGGGASGAGAGGDGAGAGAAGAAGGGGDTPSAGTGGAGGDGSGGSAAGAGGAEAGSGGASGAGGAGSGGGGGQADAGTAGGPAPSGAVTVGIVRRDDIDEALARAVELAGGLDAIQPGDSVFIKPNMVSDRALGTPGIRTSLELIAAVVRLVKSKNPGYITVGDASARAFVTTDVFDNVGIAQVVMDAGADEVYPAPSNGSDPNDWVLVQPTSWEETWSADGGIYAMKRILDADHLINVPTCKDHRYAAHSLSMKNFIGAVAATSRNPLHYFPTDFMQLGRQIALLNQPFMPLMNILDATTALINGGPEGDGADAVRTSPGLVIASRDRVALDAAGLSLIKLELGRTTIPQPDAANATLMSTSPWQMPQLVNAASLGLGVAGPGEVELRFDDVPDEAELRQIYQA